MDTIVEKNNNIVKKIINCFILAYRVNTPFFILAFMKKNISMCKAKEQCNNASKGKEKPR